MTTLLNLNVNKILTAHGELNTDKHFSLGADKFKLDGEEGAAGTLVTSLASTFNGTVLLGDDAKLTATGDVDVKSIFRVQNGGDDVKLTINPESSEADAFDLDLNANLKQKLNVVGDTTLKKLTAGECIVDSVSSSGLIHTATLTTSGIADFGGLATAKAGMRVEGAPLTVATNMTVEQTGTFKAEGDAELHGVVKYFDNDDPANIKFILDHNKIGVAGQYGLVCDMKSHFKQPLEAVSMKVTGNSDLAGITASSLSVPTGGITVGTKVSSATLQTTGEARVGGSLTVDGDIIVNGSMTTVESKEVNIGDNHIYLNADKTVVGETDAGIVTNCNVSKTYKVRYPSSGVATFVFLADDGVALTSDNIDLGALVQVTGFKGDNAHLNGIHAIEFADNNAKAYRLERPGEEDDPIAFLNRADVNVPDISADDLAEVRASLVSVGHLMFCADHKTVKFAYGSNRSEFVIGDVPGASVGTGSSYTDLIKGDVQHTYKEVPGGGADVDIVANVTQVTGAFSNTDGGLVLPSNAPKGSEYKVINSHSSPITVKGDMYNGEGSADVYSSMIFTRGKDKWYNV